MMRQNKIDHAIAEHSALLERFKEQSEDLKGFAHRLVEGFTEGKRLILVCSPTLREITNLVANIFLHRLSFDRPALPVISLCHDSTLAASLQQDGQQVQYYTRQLRIAAQPGDTILSFGDTQRCEALDAAMEEARQIGCLTAALVQGNAAPGKEAPDFSFQLAALSVPRSFEATLLFGTLLCELVEAELFGI